MRRAHELLHEAFKEEGMTAGVAYGEDGVARGAMGADAADYDRSGRPHLLVGNFSNQMLGLYHNEGNGLFVDESPSSSVGRACVSITTCSNSLAKRTACFSSTTLNGKPLRRFQLVALRFGSPSTKRVGFRSLSKAAR